MWLCVFKFSPASFCPKKYVLSDDVVCFVFIRPRQQPLLVRAVAVSAGLLVLVEVAKAVWVLILILASASFVLASGLALAPRSRKHSSLYSFR
jgi:hypothetical protein